MGRGGDGGRDKCGGQDWRDKATKIEGRALLASCFVLFLLPGLRTRAWGGCSDNNDNNNNNNDKFDDTNNKGESSDKAFSPCCRAYAGHRGTAAMTPTMTPTAMTPTTKTTTTTREESSARCLVLFLLPGLRGARGEGQGVTPIPDPQQGWILTRRAPTPIFK